MQTLLDTAHCPPDPVSLPAAEPGPLQAWDAADEYLINHLAESQQAPDGPVIIMNDGLPLAGYLHAHAPVCVTDSHISERGHPGQSGGKNGLDPHAITLQGCPGPLPDAPALVVIKVSKGIRRCWSSNCLPCGGRDPATRIIAAGKAKDIHTSTLKLFESIWGRPAPRSPGRRHASFIAPRPPSARP